MHIKVSVTLQLTSLKACEIRAMFLHVTILNKRMRDFAFTTISLSRLMKSAVQICFKLRILTIFKIS